MALDAEAVKCIVNLRDVLRRTTFILGSPGGETSTSVGDRSPYGVARPLLGGSSLKTC